MPHRHVRLLHAETCTSFPACGWHSRRVCVMLGEIPGWRYAQRDWLLSLREFQSCLSALTDSFLFRERLRSSRPPLFFVPGTCEKKKSGAEDLSSRWQASSCWLNAHVPRHHHKESIHLSSSPSMICVPLRLRATWSRSVWVTMNCLTSCRYLLHAMPDSVQLKSSSALWLRLSTSLGSNGLRLRNHLAAGWTSGFFRGAIRPSANARTPSSPKHTTSSRNHGAAPTHTPPRPCTNPPWDLPTVLRALKGSLVWTIAILEPQSTLVENRPAVSTGVGQSSWRLAGPFRQPCLPGIWT